MPTILDKNVLPHTNAGLCVEDDLGLAFISNGVTLQYTWAVNDVLVFNGSPTSSCKIAFGGTTPITSYGGAVTSETLTPVNTKLYLRRVDSQFVDANGLVNITVTATGGQSIGIGVFPL